MTTDPAGKFPKIHLALVEHLEAVFPNRAPNLGQSLEKVWSDAEAARVVRLLRKQHQR